MSSSFRAMVAACTAVVALAPCAFAAPGVQTLTPPAGALVSSLAQVSVTFTEAVSGVDANDLLINSEGAAAVTGSGAGPYVFTFTQPSPGTVNMSWDLDHGIVGLAAGSGAFSASPPWTYTLTDATAPTVSQRTPAATATVGALPRVEVLFSEPVNGVDASDLLINGIAATSVTGSGLGPYVFSFPEPPIGAVTFDWAPLPGIQDTAAPPNLFAGGSWSVTRSAAGAGNVIINEFLAANGRGRSDEDGAQEDWIELYNAGNTPVDLVGWALTNDVDELAKWVFPSRSLAPGAYLVVFASGKNRTPTTPSTANLHTNFTINESGGYLALFSPESQSPRVAVSAFAPFPEQRTDYSYGPQPGGGLRYFSLPTPNLANGASSLVAVTPKVNASVGRGFFKDPFQLVLTCSDASAAIRYTTDFTEPTATTGTAYVGPITVSATTVVRAVAFNPTKIPSLPVTHSYIFLDEVLTQPANPSGFPTNWGTTYGTNTFPPASTTPGLVPADYAMDTDPLRVDPNSAASAVDPIKQQRLKDGLRELPIVSLTIPIIDMFGTSGIYHSNNVENKAFPYKKCAVEMLLPDGSTAFSTICGISGHGNASRTPLKNPKHGFQLKFKGDFGDSSLNYRLYPDSPVADFDDIILRPDFNSSWRHWSDSAGNPNGDFQRTRATRLRDAFVKNTFRDMGDLASHHRFFHLFINGLYWGTYDFAEQPVDGFGKSYFGGAKIDYAIIHEGVAKNGTDTVYNSMIAMANITTNTLYDQMKGYLDISAFIDYTLLHFFIAHQDWGSTKNWYAMRRRASATNSTQGKYQYIPWDDECTLLEPTVNRVSNTDVPNGLHTKLVVHPQYKLDFADRVHRHMVAPGGALTPPATIARWQKWQAVMDKPIVAESARWGDYRRDVHRYQDGAFVLYTRENQWLAENTRLVNTYFPGRPTTLLTQLRSAGLYPGVAAPEYRQGTPSGSIVGTTRVTAGFVLAMNSPGGAGTIYYTTDGNDPHIYYTPTTGATAGSVAATAQTYTAPFAINATVTVKSRILNNGAWSALNEATFAVGPPLVPVAITEIMYDPPTAAHEFIELENYGAQAVDLSACYFEGIEFVFPLGTLLGPGSRLVLASNNNPTGFALQYPGVVVAGYFGGSLDNTGERIALKAPDGSTIVSVTYSPGAPWPEGASGRTGKSLEIVNVSGDPDSPFNWQTSATLNGTPGTPNTSAPAPQVEISEVMAENIAAVSNGGVFSDYVELHNTTGAAVNITGWALVSDAFSFVFPTGATILPNEYVVVWSDNATGAPGFHTGSLSTLNRSGGSVRLQMPGGTIADGIRYGNQIVDRSIGRVGGLWTLTAASPGAANSAAATAPATGHLFVNEWFAASGDGSPDWIELYNDASLPVALSGLYFQTSAAFYRFDALAFVAPQGFVQLFADEQPTPNSLDFKLPASGTVLSILAPTGVIVDSVTFATQTPGVAQGRLPDGTATIMNFPNGGSPGAANYLLAYNGPLLNEVLVRNVSGPPAPWGTIVDWVELYNPGTSPFDLSGMRLGSRNDFGQAWIFPAGSTIGAGGYLAIWCDPGRSVSTLPGPDMNSGLSLTDDKGALYLFNSSAQLVHTVAWGFQLPDLSIGINGSQWNLLASPTRAGPNAGPATLGLTTNLRINEWFDGGIAADWFELYNLDTAPVELSGLYVTDDPSEPGLTKFQIAPLSFIAGRGWVRLWGEGVIPAGDSQVNFGLDPSGESLRLSTTNLTPIDAVSFGAQTAGKSQGRIVDGGTVQAGLTPTPRARNIPPTPLILAQPQSQTVPVAGSVTFSVTAIGDEPLTYQWRFKGDTIPGETGATLSRSGVTFANDGAYEVSVTNLASTVMSLPAILFVQHTYAQWKALHFNVSEQGNDAISGPSADPDNDGITNAQEYFHNLSPRAAPTAAERASALPEVGIEPTSGTPQFLTLTYRRSNRATVAAIEHQISPAPGATWTTATPDPIEQLSPDPFSDDSRVRVKFAIPAGETKRFVRLVITP